MFLTFFYRCAKAGTLRVEFVGVDKTGFANFNSMEVEEELSATDGTYSTPVADSGTVQVILN